jgi:hypothetical protein
MVSWNVTRTLPMPHHSHQENKEQKKIRHYSIFKHKSITQPSLTPVDTAVRAIDDLTCALKGTRNTHGMQQIERLKMIDELLNKTPSNLTEMSDPSTKTTIPRVEDIRPGLEQAPRVQNESKTTVSKKDKIKATNREQVKQNIGNIAMQRARIPQHHQMQLRQEQR